MRRRQLKHLWQRLPQLRQMKHLSRDGLLMKLGAARQQWPAAWRLVAIRVPKKDEQINEQTFTWRLRARRSCGRCAAVRAATLLRRQPDAQEDPAKLWEYYTQLTEVEEAFKNLKGDLALRPVYHQKEQRIEAHILRGLPGLLLACDLAPLAAGSFTGTDPRVRCSRSLQRCRWWMCIYPRPTVATLSCLVTRNRKRNSNCYYTNLKLTLPRQPPPRITSASKPAD